MFHPVLLPESLSTHVRSLNLSYISAACFTCTVWDHVLTFPGEVNYIWRAKASSYFTRIMFILNAYSTHVGIGILMWSAFLATRGTYHELCLLCHYLTPFLYRCAQLCVGYIMVVGILMLTSTAVTNVCIALRVYNLWERGKTSTYVLWGGLIPIYACVLVFSILTLRWIYSNVYDNQSHVCFLGDTTWYLMALLIALLVSDIFMLVMIILNALARPYRHGSEVFRRFRRDGVASFSVLAGLRLLGIILAMTLPAEAMFAAPVVQWAVSSVLLSRIILQSEEMKLKVAQERLGWTRDHDYELTAIVFSDPSHLLIMHASWTSLLLTTCSFLHPSMDSLVSIDALRAALSTAVATSYITVACFICALWDHALTFSDEVTYVWKADVNLTTVSFVFNRYSAHVGLGFLVWYETQFNAKTASSDSSNSFTSNSCVRYMVAAGALMLISLAVTNAVIALRVYNLWERGKYPTIVIWGGLTVIYTCVIIFSVIALRWLPANAFDKQLNTCFLFKTNWAITGVLTALLASDIFMLIMMVLNAFAQPYRHGSDVIRRFRLDGVVNFSMLTGLRLLGIILTVTLPPASIFIAPIVQWPLNTIFLSRLILRTEKMKTQIAQERYAVVRDYELAAVTRIDGSKSRW
ncbi:hypothetical protein NM688_g1249 [Phlebia brevispora]|uniref:Uncharacterized protein n=1 Tax=Phlebia brevispora TaxID=194682 RepID=A0ACC1TC96_9APHY|nr:hypothetical protein NM688_g1249 [Phlebia brevispora]